MPNLLALNNLEAQLTGPLFISKIDKVITMINEEAPDPYYKTGYNNINIVEEIEFERFVGKSIKDNLDCCMTIGQTRFIYVPDLNERYRKVEYSYRSNLDDKVKNMTCWIIGRECKEYKFELDLVLSIIRDKINEIFLDEYNTTLIEALDYMNKYHSANDKLNYFYLYSSIYTCLDKIFNLKYKDYTSVRYAMNYVFGYRAMKDISYVEDIFHPDNSDIDVYQEIYNYSIEAKSHTYDELKKVVSLLG